MHSVNRNSHLVNFHERHATFRNSHLVNFHERRATFRNSHLVNFHEIPMTFHSRNYLRRPVSFLLMQAYRTGMEVHVVSLLIHLSIYGAATSMRRYVTDASTWTRSHRETGCSSFHSLGLNPFVEIAEHNPMCLSTAIVGRGTLAAGSRSLALDVGPFRGG